MPEIVVKLGNKVMDTHALFQEVIRIGRSRDNDIVIDHLSVSRRHSEIRYEHGHWLIADLESANGTYVNGQRITTVPLYHADTVTVGKVHLHFFDTPIDQEETRVTEVDGDRTMILSAPPAARGCLTVIKGKQRGKEHLLESEKTLIGRAPDCHLQINDWRVAKYHAEVTRRGDGFVIEDLGTWGAILVNGKPVKEHALQEGDIIQLGGTRLAFRQLVAGMPAGSPPGSGVTTGGAHDTPSSYRMAVDAAFQMPNRTPPPEMPPQRKDGTGGRRRKGAGRAKVESAAAEGSNLLEQMNAILDGPPRAGSPAGGPNGSHVMPGGASVEDGAGLDASPAGVSDCSLGPDSTPNAAADSPAVAMWLDALKSNRPAIRRHAARQLERLTGRPYDA